jgi:hypothetical protein
MLLLLGLVAFLGWGTLSLLHSLLFAFALEATLLVLGLFLSLLLKRLVSRTTSLTAQPLSCCLARSIAGVANPTFLTHPLDLSHDSRHLALLLRQIASFAIPPQLFDPLPLSLIKLGARCLSFLASLWLRAVVVRGIGRVWGAALVAHYRLRAHDVSTVDVDYVVGLSKPVL